MRQRIRTLKPEIWQEEEVGRLSFGARLLFIGLITKADDEGRFLAMKSRLVGHVFPFDEQTAYELMAGWQLELAESGAVSWYERNGVQYGVLPNWARHQRITRPNPSTIPAPPSRKVVRENAVVAGDSGFRQVQDECKTSFTDMRKTSSAPRAHRAPACPPRVPIRSDPIPVERDLPLEQDPVARELFDLWRERCGHPKARPTRDRLRKIQTRLDEGYKPDDIRAGIEGAVKAPFVNEQGKRFDDIELICRTGAKLESFIERSRTVLLPARSGALEKMDDWVGLYGEDAS